MSTETNRQPTCEERIGAQLAGRMTHLNALTELAYFYDASELSAEAREILSEEGVAEDEMTSEDVNEIATRRFDGLPLGVSSQRVFRIDLSTGGPGDWFEVFCDGDTPAYEGGENPYTVTRVVYHFNDWFDHAERTLEGDEERTAADFAARVVPELIG